MQRQPRAGMTVAASHGPPAAAVREPRLVQRREGSCEERFNCVDHSHLLRLRHLRENRNRNYRLGGLLSDRETSTSAGQPCKALLGMEWQWVIDLNSDPEALELITKGVATGGSDGI